MFKKLSRRLPASLLVFLFRVKEVKTKREKKRFRDLWTSIWLHESYAHKDEPLPKIEAHYALFDHSSTDLLIQFLGIFPIGTMRLIWENQGVELPTLHDFDVSKDWEGSVVELTLLTLKKEWRGLHLIPPLLLWREGYQRAKRSRMTGIVMAADRRLFRLLSRMLPFRQIGEAKFYEGSETIPAFLDLEEAKATLAEKNPQLLKFFTS